MNPPVTGVRRVRRPNGMSKAQVVQWELDRAVRDGSCLITKAAKASGYGLITYEKRSVYLHRLVLEIKFGRQLEHGEFACHVCDNRGCINPDHLYVGSAQDNADDRASAGHAYTDGRRPWKLTDAQIQDIRNRHAGGTLQQDLAAEYGVSISYVSMLVNRHRRDLSP